jgi:hypothetical protein
MSLKIIGGDLFEYIQENKIQVTAQGNNCFCMQGAGIAPLFVKHFRTDEFKMEQPQFSGKYNKLGTLDFEILYYDNSLLDTHFSYELEDVHLGNNVTVVNCYTQFKPGNDADYVWLAASLKKINFAFKGMTLALPLMGGGIGGLDPVKVIAFMRNILKDVDATLVLLPNLYKTLKDK